MLKRAVAFFMLLLVAIAVKAEEKKHRVVVEVTSESAEQWQGALNNVENLQKALGAAAVEIEVVAHSKGLGLVLKSNQSSGDRVRRLADAGVTFAACQNSMRRMKVTGEDLISGVKQVDSGVAEVVRKQEAGWSYLKTGS
jgi:intracellular sulfur oxidation DsrE/DsrF family protein